MQIMRMVEEEDLGGRCFAILLGWGSTCMRVGHGDARVVAVPIISILHWPNVLAMPESIDQPFSPSSFLQ